MRSLFLGLALLGMLESTANAQEPTAKPAASSSQSDVEEKKDTTYLFLGVRYRGWVVPQAFMNLFVQGGRTVYNNGFAIELDIRKNNFSIIPHIMFAEHGMGDTLFLDKGTAANDPGNWSVINSKMNGLYANVDLLWSIKMSKNLDFEIGGTVGIGVIFGPLYANWVTNRPAVSGLPGPYEATDPNTGAAMQPFYACKTEQDEAAGIGLPGGCSRADHRNAEVAKVYAEDGDLTTPYRQKYWSEGGNIPNVIPYLTLPQIGLRIKAIKSFVARVQTGFSLPWGWFFGFSAYFGFPK